MNDKQKLQIICGVLLFIIAGLRMANIVVGINNLTSINSITATKVDSALNNIENIESALSYEEYEEL